MSLEKPYPHIYRHGVPSVNEPYFDKIKSEKGINCIASYEILKKDLKSIFEYIEPHQENTNTYSHRTFELLIRACTEVESLCKLVFKENGITLNTNKQNIIRYSDLNRAMRLSEYEIQTYGFNYPLFNPFNSFADSTRTNRSPNWYRAYNQVKHNRVENFHFASLKNVIEAVGAVYTLLVAQFGLGFDHHLRLSYHLGMQMDCPDLFRVKQLPEWLEDEKYNFDWNTLKETEAPYNYHPLPEII